MSQQPMPAPASAPAPALALRRLVHELSNPLGVCAMASSLMPAQVEGLLAHLSPQTDSPVQAQLQEWRETLALLQSGLQLCVQILRSCQGGVTPGLEPAEFDLRGTVHTAAALQIARKAKPVQLHLHMEQPMLVQGDATSWHQVLTNLVGNSLLHGFDTLAQGSIHISATRLPGQRLVLHYCDDGCGLREEVRARLFEDGFSTRLGQGGHGLGMGIVQELVCQRLQGRLQVHRPARGAHFSIEATC